MKILVLGSGGREHALAWKLAQSEGVSVYGAPGGVLYDGAGNRVLLKTLKDRLRKDIYLREIDAHINDDLFVDACVNQLITYMEKGKELKKP